MPFPRHGADALGAGLHGQALRADVQNGARVSGLADDRRQHGRRAAVQRADGVALRGVHQGVGAGAQLGDAGEDGDVVHKGRRRAVADGPAGHTVRGSQSGKAQRAALRALGQSEERGKIRRAVAVAVVGEDAAEDNVRAGAESIEKGQEIRLFDDTGAVLPDLDLDQDGDAYVLRGKDLLGLRHLAGRIDAEGDRYAARGQRGDAPQLLLADDLIGDKDILQAVFHQDLRLAGLCSSDAAGALLQLQLGDGGHFMRFGVRAELHAIAVGIALHVREIFQQPLPVDEQGRRIELIELHDGSLPVICNFFFLYKKLYAQVFHLSRGIYKKLYGANKFFFSFAD